jgi:hypothetical protein
MSIDIKKPSDAAAERPKLSKIGIISVALLLVLALVVAGMMVSSSRRRQALAENAKIVDAAVDHAVAVCRNVVTVHGDAGDQAELNGMIKRIEDEKNPLTRADIATDMIGLCLRLAQDSQSQLDELTGARNRLLIAIREYNNRL